MSKARVAVAREIHREIKEKPLIKVAPGRAPSPSLSWAVCCCGAMVCDPKKDMGPWVLCPVQPQCHPKDSVPSHPCQKQRSPPMHASGLHGYLGLRGNLAMGLRAPLGALILTLWEGGSGQASPKGLLWGRATWGRFLQDCKGPAIPFSSTVRKHESCVAICPAVSVEGTAVQGVHFKETC